MEYKPLTNELHLEVGSSYSVIRVMAADCANPIAVTGANIPYCIEQP